MDLRAARNIAVYGQLIRAQHMSRGHNGLVEVASFGAGRLVTRTISASGRVFDSGVKFRNLRGNTKAQEEAARKEFRQQHSATWGTRISNAQQTKVAASVYSFAASVDYATDRVFGNRRAV